MEQRYEAEQLTATNKSSLPDQPQFTDMQRALQRGRELAGKARGQAIESNQPRSLSQRRGVSPVNPLEGFEPLSNESTNQSMRPQLPQANPAARSSSATGNRRPMAQVSRSRTPIDQARPLSAYEQTLQERNQRPQGTKKQVTFGRPGTQFSPEEVQLFQELDGANPVWNSKRFAEGNYEAEKARYNEWIRTRSLR